MTAKIDKIGSLFREVFAFFEGKKEGDFSHVLESVLK
jgi:hypothetical protein